MNPKISALITVYNGERYVARAIDSALRQDAPAHEVIVVDDGSTDGTGRILASYGNRIVLRRIKNSGVAGAKNFGIGLVTGDYVAFLDHDDVWFRSKLSVQAKTIRRYPEAGVVTCNFAVRYPHLGFRLMKHFDILRHPRRLRFGRPLKSSVFRMLLEEHFVGAPSAALVKMEVIRKIGMFDPRYESSQDYDFWLRCATVTDFVVLADVLLYKRNHPENISANVIRTHTYRRQVLRNTLTEQDGYIRRHGLTGVCRGALAGAHYYLGSLYFEEGEKQRAFELFREGLAVDRRPLNYALYGWAVLKKRLRLWTGDALSRKGLKRLIGRDH